MSVRFIYEWWCCTKCNQLITLAQKDKPKKCNRVISQDIDFEKFAKLCSNRSDLRLLIINPDTIRSEYNYQKCHAKLNNIPYDKVPLLCYLNEVEEQVSINKVYCDGEDMKKRTSSFKVPDL